jgi:hypothetical protein
MENINLGIDKKMESEISDLKIKTDNTIETIETHIRTTESEMILRRDNLYNEIEKSVLNQKNISDEKN